MGNERFWKTIKILFFLDTLDFLGDLTCILFIFWGGFFSFFFFPATLSCAQRLALPLHRVGLGVCVGFLDQTWVGWCKASALLPYWLFPRKDNVILNALVFIVDYNTWIQS